MEEGKTRDAAMFLTVAAEGSLDTNDRLDYPISSDTKKTEQTMEMDQTMPDEDVMAISRRIMQKNRQTYELLAK